MIAEQERVGKVLERKGVLRAGDHAAVGHPAKGEDELVVGQFSLFVLGAQVNYAAFQIDASDRGFDEAGGPQERTDRERAMAGFDPPEQTSKSSGVIRRKLSRLTSTISTFEGPLNSRSK